MKKIETRSTSRSSAVTSDLVLREGPTSRLVFRPSIVMNPSNPAASVNGYLLYQRKGPKDEWADVETLPLSKLKKDEGYKLELHAGELLELVDHVRSLYKLHSERGVPMGEGHFVRVDTRIATLAQLPRHEFHALLRGSEALGANLLANLLAWATQSDDPAALIGHLRALGAPSLRRLNVAVGLEALTKALQTWRDRNHESNEEFWQNTLSDDAFVLEQVFSVPCAVVKGKAYVGGKTVLNTGGNIVDFLVKNSVTRNAGLIEIKTPATKLIGAKYRGTFNPSDELTGAVMQVLNYRHSLGEQYFAVVQGNPDAFEAFAPRCAVVIGHASRELTDPAQRKAFELFRGQLKGVDVVTFDELYERVQRIVDVLERSNAPGPEEDCPF